VRALVVFDGALWAATSGGVERYQLGSFARTHHLTRAQGLDALDVQGLEVEDHTLYARTARSRCAISPGEAHCVPSTRPLPVPRLFARTFRGMRVTSELQLAEGTLVGTHGAGLWLEARDGARALTPADQICTNHVQALTVFAGALYVGGFRDGLCVRSAGGFATLATPFRFVNALLAAEGTLYVAAHEGLFRSRDGLTFEAVQAVHERGANGLAYQRGILYVTTPAALYRLPLGKGKVSTLRRPGGSLALQGVTVHGRDLWLASEDRGALRVRNEQVVSFDALAGLPSSWVLDVAVDDQGTAHVATLKHGLVAISARGQVRAEPVPSAWLLELAVVRGVLWVGSQDGLFAGTGSRSVASLPGHEVHALVEWNDQLWVGSESGLFASALL
jgi:ligand-binding sensor domain-containing protein